MSLIHTLSAQMSGEDNTGYIFSPVAPFLSEFLFIMGRIRRPRRGCHFVLDACGNKEKCFNLQNNFNCENEK